MHLQMWNPAVTLIEKEENQTAMDGLEDPCGYNFLYKWGGV